MYKYKPERNARQALILIICLSLLTCTGFFIASLLETYRMFAQLVAVLLLAISIMMVIRYTITEIEYSVSAGTFGISKTIGNKTTPLCSLDLTTAIALVDKNTYEHSTEFSDVSIKFNYCQNIKAQSFVFVYEFNGKKGMIEFEPNTVFVKIMKDAIKKAKKEDEKYKNDESDS